MGNTSLYGMIYSSLGLIGMEAEHHYGWRRETDMWDTSSDELVKIAKIHERHDALIGDALDPPHPASRFDFVISIAVLHHLSARERRIEGVRAALYKLKRPRGSPTTKQEAGDHESQVRNVGQALFFVWALEQKGSRRGWDEGGEQDVLVPWVLKSPTESSRQGKPDKQKKKGKKRRDDTLLDHQNDGQVVEDHAQETPSAGPQDDTAKASGNVTQPSLESHTGNEPSNEHKTEQVYHRYYHLYRQGELEEDIVSAGGEIVKSGYDRDNWWCVARRKIA